jgi:hypothetical protein
MREPKSGSAQSRAKRTINNSGGFPMKNKIRNGFVR